MKSHRVLLSPLAAFAVALLAISIIVVSRNGSLRTERYFVKETPVTAQVAWYRKGDAEAPSKVWIAVGNTAQGWHGSRFRAFLAKAGETLGLITDVPEFLETSTELVAVEVPAAGAPIVTASGIPHLPSVSYRQLVAHDGKLYILDWRGYGYDLEDDEDDSSAGVPNAVLKGWHLQEDRFVEMTDREAASVSEAVGRERLRKIYQSQDPALRNQSSGWQVCGESVYSVKASGRCPLNLGGKTWTLRFNRTTTTRAFDGPVFAQLAASHDRESIRLTSNANIWVETDATTYSSRLNNSVQALRGRSGAHFTSGWTSYLFWLLIALGIPYILIRTALLQSANSKPYFPEVKPEDFPGLDHQRLADYSASLMANGFKYVRDFTAASASPSRNRPPSFARLFVNPDLKCFAEVSQIFTPQKRWAAMHCAFLTSFNDDWRFCTSDRVANPVTYIARRPRTLWLSRPGMEFSEMLSLHTRMINQMQMQVALTVTEDVSIEGYFQRSLQSVEELNKIIRRKASWLFPLILQYQYHNHRSHYEWLGNYGLKAPASAWTPPAGDADNVSSPRWQRTIKSWSPTINIVCTVMLGMSAYLMFFHPTQSAASSLFRMSISVLGLSGYAFLAIVKKMSEKV